MKRWPLLLVAIAAALGLWLLTRLVSQGFEEVAQAEAERSALEHRKAELEQRVRDLDATLYALRCDPAAVESMARQELGWVRPGEVVVLIATPTPPPSPALTQPAPTPILTLRERRGVEQSGSSLGS